MFQTLPHCVSLDTLPVELYRTLIPHLALHNPCLGHMCEILVSICYTVGVLLQFYLKKVYAHNLFNCRKKNDPRILHGSEPLLPLKSCWRDIPCIYPVVLQRYPAVLLGYPTVLLRYLAVVYEMVPNGTSELAQRYFKR